MGILIPAGRGKANAGTVLKMAASAVRERRERDANTAAAALRIERDIVTWGEEHFWIVNDDQLFATEGDAKKLIQHEPHQAALLSLFLTPQNGFFPFRTIIWSTPKKQGKTTISGEVARWAAETWGKYGLIMCVGNDKDQAKERAFAALVQSVEMTPGYDAQARILPGVWRIREDEALCYRTGTRVKATATDYAGEAGANPTLSVYTELWGFINKDALRFWAEMAPSPTRPNSIRWVETYAGYEGESELLWGLYEATVKNGRQLTAGELSERTGCALGVFEEAQNPEDLIPVYVNDAAAMAAYWDEGEIAHRMPWLKGEHGRAYYANEAATQTPSQYIRLHENRWASAESSFVPIEQWDRCMEPFPLDPDDTQTPIVLSLDAAVTGDCFGVVAVSRHPNRWEDAIAVRAAVKWTPPKGGVIDFAEVEAYLRTTWFGQERRSVQNPDGTVSHRWVKVRKPRNVVEVAYDFYQLHDLATRLNNEGLAWFRKFGQGEARMQSDKALYDLIMQLRIAHDGNPDLREHIANANAKSLKTEDTKLRIVKKSDARKIDLCVSLSMAAAECLRLNLPKPKR